MKSVRVILSLMMAIALVVVVMVSIALAREQDGGGVTVDTAGYTPKAIWAPGSYTFTYPIAAHYTGSGAGDTTTIAITATLDSALQLNCSTGTAILPGDGGTVICNGNTVVWTPVLTHCQWMTLTLTAHKNVGTLEFGAVTTVVEWDGQMVELKTPLFLSRIYLPLVMRNF